MRTIRIRKLRTLLARQRAGVVILSVSLGAQVVHADYSYTGDWNTRNGIWSQRNFGFPNTFVYDEVVTTEPMITQVWGNFHLEDTHVVGADYEIRLGVSEHNGGQLLASGTVGLENLTLLPTGRWSGTEYQVKLRTGGVQLDPGTYFLAVRPVGSGLGLSALTISDGRNIGGSEDPNPDPRHSLINGRSFLNGNGSNFADVKHSAGNELWDFSLGVETAPEPPALLCCSALMVGGAWCRRRRPRQ